MWERCRWCPWLHTGDGGHRGASHKPKSSCPHSGKPGTERLEGGQKTYVMCVLAVLLFSWKKKWYFRAVFTIIQEFCPYINSRNSSSFTQEWSGAKPGCTSAAQKRLLSPLEPEDSFHFVIPLRGRVLALIAQCNGREKDPRWQLLSQSLQVLTTPGELQISRFKLEASERWNVSGIIK